MPEPQGRTALAERAMSEFMLILPGGAASPEAAGEPDADPKLLVRQMELCLAGLDRLDAASPRPISPWQSTRPGSGSIWVRMTRKRISLPPVRSVSRIELPPVAAPIPGGANMRGGGSIGNGGEPGRCGAIDCRKLGPSAGQRPWQSRPWRDAPAHHPGG